MASFQDLKEAIKENLESRGILDQLEAQLRSRVFQVLDDDQDTNIPKSSSPENFLINQLIREYLIYNGYGHSLSVFEAESGLEKDCPERNHLAQELKLDLEHYPHSMPLLYGLCLRNRVQSKADPKTKGSSRSSTSIGSDNTSPHHQHTNTSNNNQMQSSSLPQWTPIPIHKKSSRFQKETGSSTAIPTNKADFDFLLHSSLSVDKDGVIQVSN